VRREARSANFLLNISGAKDFYALLPFFYLGLALPSTGLNEAWATRPSATVILLRE